MTKNSLNIRIKEERLRLNFKSQESIANELNISRETWNKIERGQNVPSGEAFIKMYELGFDINYIFSGIPIDLLSVEEQSLIKAWRSQDIKIIFDLLKSLVDKIPEQVDK
jgi:transcriptional regulator with XRE-family HTH domain